MTLRYDAELDDFVPVKPKRELSDIPQQMRRKERTRSKHAHACLKCGHNHHPIGPTELCQGCHPLNLGWRGHPAGAPVPFYGETWIPPVASTRRIG